MQQQVTESPPLLSKSHQVQFLHPCIIIDSISHFPLPWPNLVSVCYQYCPLLCHLAPHDTDSRNMTSLWTVQRLLSCQPLVLSNLSFSPTPTNTNPTVSSLKYLAVTLVWSLHTSWTPHQKHYKAVRQPPSQQVQEGGQTHEEQVYEYLLPP